MKILRARCDKLLTLQESFTFWKWKTCSYEKVLASVGDNNYNK